MSGAPHLDDSGWTSTQPATVQRPALHRLDKHRWSRPSPRKTGHTGPVCCGARAPTGCAPAAAGPAAGARRRHAGRAPEAHRAPLQTPAPAAPSCLWLAPRRAAGGKLPSAMWVTAAAAAAAAPEGAPAVAALHQRQRLGSGRRAPVRPPPAVRPLLAVTAVALPLLRPWKLRMRPRLLRWLPLSPLPPWQQPAENFLPSSAHFRFPAEPPVVPYAMAEPLQFAAFLAAAAALLLAARAAASGHPRQMWQHRRQCRPPHVAGWEPPEPLHERLPRAITLQEGRNPSLPAQGSAKSLFAWSERLLQRQLNRTQLETIR